MKYIVGCEGGEGMGVAYYNGIVKMRGELRSYLESIFGTRTVQFIPRKEIIQGAIEIVERTDAPIVSLDNSYLLTTNRLSVSRCVDSQMNSIGIRPRFGELAIDHQIQRLLDSGLREVVLFDDVIFSGESVIDLSERLRRVGILVRKIIAGIAIRKGCDSIRDSGIEVEAAINFNEVIDEICERDFYAGIPYSGRSMDDPLRNIGVPYFMPFGKSSWVSIPENKFKDFSCFCIEASIRLWEFVEEEHGRIIIHRDVPRALWGINDESRRFVNILQDLLAKIKK
jgi:hypothetical protein